MPAGQAGAYHCHELNGPQGGSLQATACVGHGTIWQDAICYEVERNNEGAAQKQHGRSLQTAAAIDKERCFSANI
jgi:hypothetical protein